MSEFNPQKYQDAKEQGKFKQKRKRKTKRNKDSIIAEKLGDMSIDDVAKIFRVSSQTVRCWIYERRIPDSRILDWCAITGDLPEKLAPHIYPPHRVEALKGYIDRIYSDAA